MEIEKTKQRRNTDFKNYAMTQYEISRAIFEYDIAIGKIQLTKFLGYKSHLRDFTYAMVEPPHKPTDKVGVVYQTDFINETMKDFLENEKPIQVTLKKLKKWFDELLIQHKEAIDWDGMFLTNPENLGEVLQTHYYTMPHNIYWKMVARCYKSTSFAHTNQSTILRYLNDTRPEKEHLMNEEEREFFNNLPDEVTIYRGCTKTEIKSGKYRMSWTLDKKVAEFFAFKYVNFTFEKSLNKDKSLYDVVEKTVNKKDLLCYFGGRNESEVLYIPKN